MTEDLERPEPANDSAPSDQAEPKPPVPLGKRPRRPPALIAFQADALEIEEQEPPGPARYALYGIIGFIIAAVLWAALSEVDQVVTAQGRLVTKEANLVVQPLETSVIRSVDVAPGDVVTAGTALATLDPTVSAADVDQLEARRIGLTARVERLTAEVEGKAYRPSPGSGPDAALQSEIHRQRRAHYDAQLRKFDQDLAELEASMATNRTDQKILVDRLAVLKEIEGMRAELLARQTGSKLNLLEARHLRLELDGALAHLRQQEKEQHHRAQALEAERDAFIEDFRRAALEELAEVRAERDRIVEELEKARFRQQMVYLTAPADAVVLDVAERSVGSVVREAEPLVTLVPLAAPLEAEVAIDASDIGQVVAGQTARIKLNAYPFQKHGTAEGIVRMVSGDAFAPQGETMRPPFYRARVEVTDIALRNLPETFRILPGMTLSAEILTGRRTVLSYFLYPLIRGLDESVREP